MSGSGAMNRRITIQRATVERNSFNEGVETWATLATVWAERRDVSTKETLAAAEVGAELTTRFTIRYSPTVADVNARDRLLYNGIVHNITGVREKDMNRKLEIDCVSRQDVAAVDETGSP